MNYVASWGKNDPWEWPEASLISLSGAELRAEEGSNYSWPRRAAVDRADWSRGSGPRYSSRPDHVWILSQVILSEGEETQDCIAGGIIRIVRTWACSTRWLLSRIRGSIWSSRRGSAVVNLTGVCGDAGPVLGLAQGDKDPMLPRAAAYVIDEARILLHNNKILPVRILTLGEWILPQFLIIDEIAILYPQRNKDGVWNKLSMSFRISPTITHMIRIYI